MSIMPKLSSSTQQPKKPSDTSALAKAVVYILLLIGTVMMLLPLLWMVSTSLSSSKYALTFPPQFLPKSIHFENYIKIFTNNKLGLYLGNTILVTIPAIVGQIISCSLAAYAFARLRAPGRKVLFIILLSTMMIPGEVTMIPTFILFRYLHWLNTFWPLIVPNFFGSAFNIFMMRQLYMNIPTEIDDAAKIDGLGVIGVWWRIIMPLSIPAVATVAIFTFSANWGNFMGPLIYINDPSKYTLAQGIYMMTQTQNVMVPPQWNLIMAGSMLLTIPMIFVYFWGQRFIYESTNVFGKS